MSRMVRTLSPVQEIRARRRDELVTGVMSYGYGLRTAFVELEAIELGRENSGQEGWTAVGCIYLNLPLVRRCRYDADVRFMERESKNDDWTEHAFTFEQRVNELNRLPRGLTSSPPTKTPINPRYAYNAASPDAFQKT
jgi:hypothetical protein